MDRFLPLGRKWLKWQKFKSLRFLLHICETTGESGLLGRLLSLWRGVCSVKGVAMACWVFYRGVARYVRHCVCVCVYLLLFLATFVADLNAMKRNWKLLVGAGF